MVRHEAREACVLDLRQHVRADTGLVHIRKDASRVQMDAVMAAVRASTALSPESKAAAETSYTAWKATFDETATAETAAAAPAAQRPATAEPHARGLKGRATRK